MPCCVCLQNTVCILNIFDDVGLKLHICEVIEKHLWFKPLPDNYELNTICNSCWKKLKDFHEFYQMAEKIHSVRVNSGNIEMVITSNGNEKKSSNLSEVAIIKEEKLESEEQNIFLNHSLCESPTDSLIKNPLFETEIESIEIIAHDECKVGKKRGRKPIHNIKENKRPRGRPRKIPRILSPTVHYFPSEENISVLSNDLPLHEISNEYPTFEPTNNQSKKSAESVHKENNILKKTIIKYNKKPKLKMKIGKKPSVGKCPKGKMLLKENENLVQKHLKMLCDLCPYTANDFIDLTRHFKQHHPGIKSYIKCCTRKLNCASDIIQHAHLHEDPNYFMCSQCERTFSNRSTLKDHFLQYHAPEENLPFACDVCPRKFARYNLLQHHKSKHIPKEKRSFFCKTCNPPRAFANEYILQVHINSRHLKATNICHVCAKEIRSKQSFEKHVRSHFGESGPRVKCPREDCNSWLKDNENLKQHLRRFHSVGEELQCPQCGRLCRSKHSLANHLRETHSSRVFTCEECKKTFKSAKSLKEHTAGHSGEPLYSCQFCSRTFNSSANMYSHKKKKHPTEWELVCHRNRTSSIK